MLKHVVYMQIPLLPVYCNLSIHPASFFCHLCHCLVASVHAKTCGPHADASLASILQSEHTPCQFLVPGAALSC